MKKLEYNWTSDKDKSLISNILEKPSIKSSCWWSNLKNLVGGFKSIEYAITKMHHNFLETKVENQQDNARPTIKTCPAIVGLLKKSFLIKAPCDILITVNNKGEWVSEVADTDMIKVSNHNADQYMTESKESNLFDNKFNLKFEYPVVLRSSMIPWIFLQPTYHKEMWFQVAQGVIEGKYTKAQALNLNVFVDIPKETQTYKIKHGDVLAYLWLPEMVELQHRKKGFFDKLPLKTWTRKSLY